MTYKDNRGNTYIKDLSEGLIDGYSTVFKFGANPDVDSGTVPEDVWDAGGVYPFPSSAATLSVVSDDVNDDVGSTGATSIEIQGLDSNYALITESVDLDGTPPVATTSSFLRVFRALVTSAGTTETNEGTITISHTATTVATIRPSLGQTLMAIYTVPANCVALVDDWVSSIQKKQSASAQLAFQVRPFGGAWNTKQTVSVVAQGTPFVGRDSKSFFRVPEKADIRIRVLDCDSTDVAIGSSFDFLLKTLGS